jgi:hypothetical protein
VRTGTGVGQGRCLSPILFNLHSECLVKELLKGLETSKQEDEQVALRNVPMTLC